MVKLDIKKINLILERDYNSKVPAERFMKYEKILNQYFEFLKKETLWCERHPGNDAQEGDPLEYIIADHEELIKRLEKFGYTPPYDYKYQDELFEGIGHPRFSEIVKDYFLDVWGEYYGNRLEEIFVHNGTGEWKVVAWLDGEDEFKEEYGNVIARLSDEEFAQLIKTAERTVIKEKRIIEPDGIFLSESVNCN